MSGHRNRKRKPEKRKRQETAQSLCWECAKAYGGCDWSKQFTPVKGWQARRNDLSFLTNGKVHTTESYEVKACPEFEQEKR